ncbi:MAG: nucleotidyl transferase AbiEii/AbiGii toxin family protein [Candidatus Blackburnbacteria bacterium]|nr:nucleotidyl transferase AbiEii/AbiGii toxin family protein [Candidatus Blackburnbacteria bacterium]
MGQGSILTKEQKQILDLAGRNDYIKSTFYFTGGTALSEVYLKHRESVDVDLFTLEKLDTQHILAILNDWSITTGFTITPRVAGHVYMCMLKFSNGVELKVDFAHYPYRHLENTVLYKGIPTNSLLDIAVNKLLTVNQRVEVKDFVDLYFLLQKFNFWDLREGVRIKFNVDLDSYLAAIDFTGVENFTTLPKMLKPLTLEQLKTFFVAQAKELGLKSVE